MADDSPRRVEDVLDRLEEASGEAERVAVGDMAGAMGERSHGPSLLVPALLDISPVGSIPGVPTVLAVILLIFAAQLAIGRRYLWLPGFIAGRRLGSARLRRAIGRLRPPARWMDRWFHGRLPLLTSEPFRRAAGAACMALAIAMPPLEVLPFATTLVSAPIAVFGLSLLLRDGLLMILGFALGAVALGGVLWTVAF